MAIFWNYIKGIDSDATTITKIKFKNQARPEIEIQTGDVVTNYGSIITTEGKSQTINTDVIINDNYTLNLDTLEATKINVATDLKIADLHSLIISELGSISTSKIQAETINSNMINAQEITITNNNNDTTAIINSEGIYVKNIYFN